ncbi:hypothetical protein DFQ02_10827 [Seonamhaeicola aphaedonensis]|uniref:Type IV leader peptidase family protein n=1 Tax=Seonamhaeicola aphaedonensis TaxID=1461338 RepID=A0A3D9H850_9FLAO|nr:hypothetical protein DFQ02_10827 [Seonamhaeicola aphaedonensis]
MGLTATIILIGVLVLVFIQDFKNRAIHVMLPIGLLLAALVVNYTSNHLRLLDIAYNILFVLINLFGLMLYLSFKEKHFINPIDTYLGLGDIVFFLAVTPLFNFKSFILFFIFGLLFSLLLHIGLKWMIKINSIPLAGYLSLFLMLIIVDRHLLKINPFF